MITRTFSIANPHGFHVRPTKLFVDKATLFTCDIFLIHKNKRINGKSSLGVLSLCLAKHAEVTLEADGLKEEEAVKELGEILTGIFE